MRAALAASVLVAGALALGAGGVRAAPFASGSIERPVPVAPAPSAPPAASHALHEQVKSPDRPAGEPGAPAEPAPERSGHVAGPRPDDTHARLALVIDDLGPNAAAARRVLDLPGPVACAVLPGSGDAAAIARAARAAGREVLVHLPMRAPRGSVSGSPYLLDVGMPDAAVQAVLARALAAVPGAVGVNNHQGSTVTAQAAPMAALMRALAGTGLWFLDSRTTPATVAAREAVRAGIPVLERQVFLDHDRTAAAVRAQFDRAVALARRDGQALAIGHPHPVTLAVLAERLAGLRETDVVLVAPSALLGVRPPSRSLDMALTGGRLADVPGPSPRTARRARPGATAQRKTAPEGPAGSN